MAKKFVFNAPVPTGGNNDDRPNIDFEAQRAADIMRGK